MKITNRAQSRDGSTKYLLELKDGAKIETIWIPLDNQKTNICVSCQIGCVNKCSYCATGKVDFVRDLSASEILEQIDTVLEDVNNTGKGCTNHILFMGMGEPLFNFDGIISTIELLIEDRNIAPMNIYLSTSGVVPGIERLAFNRQRPRLAISVNSPFSSERDRLMPINKVFPLATVISACKDYVETTHEKVIIEYVLLHEINTSPAHATALAELLPSAVFQYHLIPFNSWPGARYFSPSQEEITSFLKNLKDGVGTEVHLKPSRGVDVWGGCGQLAGIGLAHQNGISE